MNKFVLSAAALILTIGCAPHRTTKVYSNTETVAQLEAYIAEIQAALAAQETETAQLEADLLAQVELVDSISNELSTLENELAELSTTISELEAQVAELDAFIDKCKDKHRCKIAKYKRSRIIEIIIKIKHRGNN